MTDDRTPSPTGRRLSPRLVIGGVLLLAGTALGVSGPAAHASDASVDGGVLRYTAGAGEANRLVVAAGPLAGTVVLRDPGAALPAEADSPGCVREGETLVCAGVVRLVVDLRDRDDVLHNETDLALSALGGTGSDVLHGGRGPDELHGGQGDDGIAFDDGGADELYGGDGDDRLSGGGNLVSGVAGRDRLEGGAGDDVLIGGEVRCSVSCDGPDDLLGGAGSDTLIGGSGEDLLDGGAGDDSLSGGDGDDRLVGGPGADALSGGAGPRDTADYSASTEGVLVSVDAAADDGTAGEGDFVRPDVEDVLGGDGADRLTGGAAANRLVGGPGADVLRGGAGDDALDGGAGPDELDGEGGVDLADYAASLGGVDVDLATGSGPGGDVLTAVEDVQGGDGPDVLQGDGGANALRGGDGDDVLAGRAGPDSLTGDAGGDRLRGDDGNDELAGGSGNDELEGGSGSDRMSGGDDSDTVSWSGAQEPVVVSLDGQPNDGGGLADDGATDDAGADIEHVLGGPFDDELVGSSSSEELVGGGGDDLLVGRGGEDDLVGGPGTDTASYQEHTGDVVVDLTSGLSTVDASLSGIENVFGGSGDDVLVGDDGRNHLAGGDGNDTIEGRGGDDVEQGDDGADVFDQGAAPDGADEITGGFGGAADRVSYAARTTAVRVTPGDATDDGAAGEGDRVDGDVLRVEGGAGDDVLATSAGGGTVLGGPGSDVLQGGPGDDRLLGGDGADVLAGGAGADVLDGEAGDDELRSPSPDGADVLRGGAGSDTVSYAGRTTPLRVTVDAFANDGATGEGDLVQAGDVETIVGGGADDVLTGGALPEVLRGGAGNDVLSGLGAGDVLIGGLGDDTERGGAGNDVFDQEEAANGADTLYGDGGSDTVRYAARTAPVVVALDAVATDGAAGEGDLVATTVENVTGGAGDDRLAGSKAANRLEGGAGADTIDGLAGKDVQDGGSGDDTLLQGRSADGADVLIGGPDADRVSYAGRTTPVVVAIDAGAGDGAAREGDAVRPDVEHLVGGAAADRLTGSAAANTLDGGAGNDRLTGLAGDDRLVGGAGTDVLDGGTGTDTAVGKGDTVVACELRA